MTIIFNGEFEQILAERLAQRRKKHLYRLRIISDHFNISKNFSSNDYLGLSKHSAIIDQLADYLHSSQSIGSGGSHLLCGHYAISQQLEQELAEFTNREAALLFSCGYMANLGVISALADASTTIFADKLNHASLNQAMLLSHAKFKRFIHANTENLSNKLQSSRSKFSLIISDGVFSMDGDIAPLKELVSLAALHKSWLMIDDAHGFGILGKKGEGCTADFNQQEVPILVGTFGKSFGTCGAFVAGSKLLIDNLIQFAKPYIYSTALPAALNAATLKALAIIKQESWRRDKLNHNIEFFTKQAESRNLIINKSITAIQPIFIGDTESTIKISEYLRLEGFLVMPIRYPTVPRNQARLRVTLTALHSKQDIILLLDTICKYNKKYFPV